MWCSQRCGEQIEYQIHLWDDSKNIKIYKVRPETKIERYRRYGIYLLCGAKPWTLRKSNLNKTTATDTRFLRMSKDAHDYRCFAMRMYWVSLRYPNCLKVHEFILINKWSEHVFRNQKDGFNVNGRTFTWSTGRRNFGTARKQCLTFYLVQNILQDGRRRLICKLPCADLTIFFLRYYETTFHTVCFSQLSLSLLIRFATPPNSFHIFYATKINNGNSRCKYKLYFYNFAVLNTSIHTRSPTRIIQYHSTNTSIN